jgi:hypothetical protein
MGDIMTDKEIENKRNELIQIVKMSSGTNNERLKKLRELASEVGASHKSIESQKTANEGELVVGIHTALQTASMLNTCKAATKAWIIALISAFASVLSAGAAWMAVIQMK